MLSPIGSQTGMLSDRFSSSVMISEGSCIRLILLKGLNRQFRKVTKTKSSFPSDTALEKMLYLASQDIVKNGFSVTGTGI